MKQQTISKTARNAPQEKQTMNINTFTNQKRHRCLVNYSLANNRNSFLDNNINSFS